MTAPDAPQRVSSLRELPTAIEPGRDLWPEIEARLRPGAAPATTAGRAARARRFAAPPLRWLAAAAMVACVAVGVWIGRSVVPNAPLAPPVAAVPTPVGSTLQTAWVTDPRYQRERNALLESLQAQLASLPPASRAKVLSSLATIRHAKDDLEAALGNDPSNALLQELLVNTYQDEMRVLTDVREASEAGKGI